MLSMCMKPSPILHRPSTVSSRVSFYDIVMSDCEIDPIAIRTYDHIVEVSFELPGDLAGELAARDR